MNNSYATRPAVEISLADLAALFTSAFTGYIGGSPNLDAAAIAAFLVRDNVDLNLSSVLYDTNAPTQLLGLAFISRQGWTSRLAAMGIVPDVQSGGAGTWFMQHLIEAAKQRGERAMELEAYEQNTRAVKLYTRFGFQIVRRLYGYEPQQVSPSPAQGLTEIDHVELARQMTLNAADNLPWQISGAAITRWSLPGRAYRLGHAYVAISDPQQDVIYYRALLVDTSHRKQGQGRSLLAALSAQWPNKQWSVQPLCPKEYGGFFERLGFTRKPLNQVQMRYEYE